MKTSFICEHFNTKHGKVLQVLAAKGAGANDEVLCGAQLPLEVFSKDGHLSLVAQQVGLALIHNAVLVVEHLERLFRQSFAAVKEEELIDGREFSGASLFS